jgi:hypothetical protein
MAQKPETVFRKRVRADLKKLPDTAIYPIQQKTIIGDPDFILDVRGFFVALELKAEEGELSPLQKYKLSQGKGRGYVAYPTTWKEIYSELMKLAKGDRYDHTDK